MTRSIQSVAILLLLLCAAIPAFGQGWSQPLPTGTNSGLNGLFSVSSAMTIVVGNNGTIIGTSDGGNTWSTGSSGTSNHLRKVFVSGLAAPVITAIGDNGTIVRSVNGGLTWAPSTSGVSLDLLDIFVHDPTVGSTLTIVGESGVILFSNNAGAIWNLRLSPVPKTLNGVFFKTLADGFAVGNEGTIIKTTNSGGSWQVVSTTATANLNHVYFNSIDTGWIVGDGGLIMKSTDAGATWAAVSSPTTENLRRVMFTSLTTGTTVGDQGVILYTTDGGYNWTQQNSGTTHDLESVFFVDAVNGMACGEQGLVIVTSNGGVPVELSAFSAAHQSDGTVALHWRTETETQNFGFDIERDRGDGWQTAGFVAGHGNSSSVRDYAFIDNDAGDATSLRYRLRQRDFDGGWDYSPVVELDRMILPSSVSLSAWPNPFTPSTNIQVRLSQPASVRLSIFDSNGRLCETLFDGTLAAGTHVLPWRADALPSGRYIAVLQADGTSRVSELILQK